MSVGDLSNDSCFQAGTPFLAERRQHAQRPGLNDEAPRRAPRRVVVLRRRLAAPPAREIAEREEDDDDDDDPQDDAEDAPPLTTHVRSVHSISFRSGLQTTKRPEGRHVETSVRVERVRR
jgi:hypothetical protein